MHCTSFNFQFNLLCAHQLDCLIQSSVLIIYSLLVTYCSVSERLKIPSKNLALASDENQVSLLQNWHIMKHNIGETGETRWLLPRDVILVILLITWPFLVLNFFIMKALNYEQYLFPLWPSSEKQNKVRGKTWQHLASRFHIAMT